MEIDIGSVWFDARNPNYTVRVLAADDILVRYTALSSNCTCDMFTSEFKHVFTLKSPQRGTSNVPNSSVYSPQHYQVFPDKEAIVIIASAMTTEQFYGYCLGNFLKYRLRIGAKDEVQQELGKSNKYKELYEKHRHLCK